MGKTCKLHTFVDGSDDWASVLIKDIEGSDDSFIHVIQVINGVASCNFNLLKTSYQIWQSQKVEKRIEWNDCVKDTIKNDLMNLGNISTFSSI
jgi:hypothetical protein